jgi:site-specific DNA-cytosine methylase
MRVLVACEYSGVVRDAFIAKGHDAMSCDLLPTDVPGPHYQGDVFDIIDNARWSPGRPSRFPEWDLLIAHPPCTHLAVSGARHFAAKRESGVQQEALEFVRRLLDAPIGRIALENPVSIISSKIRKPDQIVQPWWFGHPETKSTCLWLKNLPPLTETNNVEEHMLTLPKSERNRIHYASPGPGRWKLRSTTYTGLAAAMAEQWGNL